MRNRESFNTAAKLYDEVRPSYPTNMVDWIIKKAKLNSKKELLEIAPGTGQATIRFAEKGFKIHAVELGDKLAELLRINMKQFDVSVDVAPFEEWDSKGKKYPFIYCATAFHWLDKDIKYKKTSDLLEEDGYLALIWNKAKGSNNKIINKAYDLLFECYPDRVHSTKPKQDEVIKTQYEILKEEIEDSGFYLLEDYYEQYWEMKQPREKTIKGFYSQSSYLSLEPSVRDEVTKKLEVLFKELDDNVSSAFLTTVFLCKKVT